MKNFLYVSLMLLLTACQVIPEAERIQPVDGPDGELFRRHVLLVELTGWSCPNCPEGAQVAHDLLEAYPQNLVVVEMHPSVNRFTKGSPYTSAAGDAYFASWGGTATNPTFPSGVVNFNSGFLDRFAWSAFVTDLILADALPVAHVDLQLTTDEATRTITAQATTAYDDDAQLLLWLVEDGIVGLQANGSETIKDYVHNHVLRASLYDDPWGATTDQGTFPTASYVVPAQYAWQNLKVVAVLLDPATRAVLDVCEKKVVE